jgi:murein DD-endopeptidase MepM/ murein hydrolase activator NlpD
VIRRLWSDARPPSARPRRRLAGLLALALVVPLIGGIPGVPSAHGDDLADAIAHQKELAARIAAQRRQVSQLSSLQADLKGEMTETSRALASINADLAVVRKRIEGLAGEIAVVKANYAGLVIQLADLDDQLVSIQAQEREKAADLSDRKAILAQRVRAAYLTDRTSLLETVLSSDSFSDILTDVGYLIDFGAQDKELAQQIARDQEALAALRQSVADTRAATETLRIETAHQRAELADRIADFKTAQAQLRQLEKETARKLAIQRANFKKLARTKAALDKVLALDRASQAALKKKIAEIVRKQKELGNIPSVYNGTLIWPMEGDITQEFGCTGFEWEPPEGSCDHYHHGIDIAADLYAPVLAAGPGTVLFAGPNPYDPSPKAWIVIVAHSEELLTWYAHLDNAKYPPSVRAGDTVKQGEIVGYEGMTGRTTGPHLHWAVEFRDDFVNPRLFV